MTPLAEMDTAARAVLEKNDRGGYTVPTDGLYPYQWNWDSAFAAAGFAVFDLDRAWRELETLITGQWDDGMIPHILFHRADDRYFPGPDVWQGRGPINSSGISQPPVAAIIAKRLYDQDPDFGADRARALFEPLRKWHDWWFRWREDRGAVCVTHPWESGRDNAPDWDPVMARIDAGDIGPYQRRDTSHVDPSMRPTKDDYDRYLWLVRQGRECGWDQAVLKERCPFRVADPTLTFILLRAHRDLKALGEALDITTDGMAEEISRLEAGAETLWNAELGSYDSRDTVTGAWTGSVSNASFLCWFAGVDRLEQREKLVEVLAALPFGVPSLSPDSPLFDGKRYWRGPVWGMMNMMIGVGLTEHGDPLGEEVRERTRKLLQLSGFAEYYDPTDGSPAGGGAFTWTAAVWLSWACPGASGR